MSKQSDAKTTVTKADELEPYRARARREIADEREARAVAEVEARANALREADERSAVHARLCKEHGLDPAVTSIADVARVEWLADRKHHGEIVSKYGVWADPARYARGSLAPLGDNAA